jgi:competence protein ComEC
MSLLGACILAGAYALQRLPVLPATSYFVVLLGIAVLAAQRPRLRPMSCAAIGFSIMGIAASGALAERLDPSLDGADLQLTVRIVGFADVDGEVLRFIAAPLSRPDLPGKVRLSWIETRARPAPGEHWYLHVRLRRPAGLSNPGGFDQAAWLLREGVGATGYVRSERHNYRLHGTPRPALDRLRAALVSRLQDELPPGRARAVLLAISVGARHAFDRADWDLFAVTGTSHLMAISGLHIGLAASAACLFGWLIATVFVRKRPARDIALVIGIVTAGVYALISGAAVPAVRAVTMSGAGAALLLWRRRLPPVNLLSFVLVAVFLSAPLSALTPGFKLSFAAVAVLLLALRVTVTGPGRAGNRGVTSLRRLVLLQWWLMFSLLPLTVLEFGRFSLAAPLVNLLVLPVFNLLTVPMTLLGLLLAGPLGAVSGSAWQRPRRTLAAGPRGGPIRRQPPTRRRSAVGRRAAVPVPLSPGRLARTWPPIYRNVVHHHVPTGGSG